MGETWGLTPAQTLALTGRDRGELSATFQFEHLLLGRVGGDKFLRCEVDRKEFVDILAKWEYGLKDDGCPVLVMENHDQPRALSRFGDEAFPFESATMLAVLLYGMRGIAVIYEGQELGLSNPKFKKLSDYRDIETLNACRDMKKDYGEAELLRMMNFGSRDNARVGMPWDGSANAGFTKGTPWISADFDPQRTVAAEEANAGSVLNFYRKLFALRQNDKVLLHGGFELLQNENGTVLYRRESGGETRYIAVRFADTPSPLPAGLPRGAKLLLCNYPGEADTLRPYEARI